LVRQLAGAGAAIVGSASTVEAAHALLEDGVDLAILDINLKGRMSFALADELARHPLRLCHRLRRRDDPRPTRQPVRRC